MKLKCGGVEGGWMQVVDVGMNQDESCPVYDMQCTICPIMHPSLTFATVCSSSFTTDSILPAKGLQTTL